MRLSYISLKAHMLIAQVDLWLMTGAVVIITVNPEGNTNKHIRSAEF